eukprot:3960061-Prymnesium_polylepis.2
MHSSYRTTTTRTARTSSGAEYRSSSLCRSTTGSSWQSSSSAGGRRLPGWRRKLMARMRQWRQRLPSATRTPPLGTRLRFSAIRDVPPPRLTAANLSTLSERSLGSLRGAGSADNLQAPPDACHTTSRVRWVSQ